MSGKALFCGRSAPMLPLPLQSSLLITTAFSEWAAFFFSILQHKSSSTELIGGLCVLHLFQTYRKKGKAEKPERHCGRLSERERKMLADACTTWGKHLMTRIVEPTYPETFRSCILTNELQINDSESWDPKNIKRARRCFSRQRVLVSFRLLRFFFLAGLKECNKWTASQGDCKEPASCLQILNEREGGMAPHGP